MHTTLNDRLSVIRQLLAKLAANKVVLSDEGVLATSLTAARQQLIFAEKALANPTVLPGPTGESNTLHLESRGTVSVLRCPDTSFEFWLVSVVSALAAGNSVIALVDEAYQTESETIASLFEQVGLPRGAFHVITINYLNNVLTAPEIAGVVVDNNSSLKYYVGEQLAARQGAILPLIQAYANESLFYRLVTEKTVTIDTTAAGGNASLMTMESNT